MQSESIMRLGSALGLKIGTEKKLKQLYGRGGRLEGKEAKMSRWHRLLIDGHQSGQGFVRS